MGNPKSREDGQSRDDRACSGRSGSAPGSARRSRSVEVATEEVVTGDDKDEKILEGAKAGAGTIRVEDATDDEGGNEDRPFDFQYSHALGKNGMGLRPNASLFMQQGSTETEQSNATNTGGALMNGLGSANYGLMSAGNNQNCLETTTDQVGGRDCALGIGQSHLDRSSEGTVMPEVLLPLLQDTKSSPTTMKVGKVATISSGKPYKICEAM